MKQLIYFHERNIRDGKIQMLQFTILPGNWCLWRSEILCEILSLPLTLSLVPTDCTLSRWHSYEVSSNWMQSLFRT